MPLNTNRKLDQIHSLPFWVKRPTRYIPGIRSIEPVFLEDFEGALTWETSGGTSSKDNTAEVYEGSYCLKHTITGAVGTIIKRISLSRRIFDSAFLVMNYHWHVLNTGSNLDYVLFDHGIYDYANNTGYEAEVKYIADSAKWQFLNKDNTFQDVADGAESITQTLSCHRHAQLVVDMRKKEYLYFSHGSKHMNLPGQKLSSWTPVANDNIMELILYHSAKATLASTYYVDAISVLALFS